MKPLIVNGRYHVKYKLGEGGFGLVYAGDDTKSGRQVAMKLMLLRDEWSMLENEANVYRTLAGPGIPQVYWSGYQDDYYVLVHEILGPSLDDLFYYCEHKFSLKTLLLIADQAIRRIQHIHSKGYLHLDIKPDNFLMGLGRQGNLIYCIDFGLAQEFSGDSWGLGGGGRTLRYASLNTHYGRQQSWRDDLESLGYVLLYFAKGSLPWQGLNAEKEKELNELIKEVKTNTTTEALCQGLPGEFATYLDYVRALPLDERPNYAYLRRLFSRLFKARGFKHDNIFDWTERRFKELHNLAADPTTTSTPAP